jgi:hypothetical protein
MLVNEWMHDAKVMKTYVETCLEVAKEAGVGVVDVYSGLVNDAGGDTVEHLTPYFA